MMGGGYGMGMGLGWIFGLIFIAVVVWAVFRISRSGSSQTRPPSGRNEALEILKERYAKGEIKQAEFERMKRELA